MNAWLALPTGIAFDSAGNLYFADTVNRVVRQVNTGGTISTFAGNEMLFFGNNGDGGLATSAIFGWGSSNFIGLAVDQAGNVYISDTSNGIGRVRKVNPAGIISTVAGTGVIGYSDDGAGGCIRSGARPRLCGFLPVCHSSAGVPRGRRLGADRDYARIFETERRDLDCPKLTCG